MNKNCFYTTQGEFYCNTSQKTKNKPSQFIENFYQGGQCSELNKNFSPLIPSNSGCTVSTDSISDTSKCTYKIMCPLQGTALATGGPALTDPMQTNSTTQSQLVNCNTLGTEIGSLLTTYKCSSDLRPDKCTFNFTCLD